MSAQAADAVFRHECRESFDVAFSRKLLDRVGSAAAFLESKELECLSVNARDVTLLNLDLERLQARCGANSPPSPSPGGSVLRLGRVDVAVGPPRNYTVFRNSGPPPDTCPPPPDTPAFYYRPEPMALR